MRWQLVPLQLCTSDTHHDSYSMHRAHLAGHRNAAPACPLEQIYAAHVATHGINRLVPRHTFIISKTETLASATLVRNPPCSEYPAKLCALRPTSGGGRTVPLG